MKAGSIPLTMDRSAAERFLQLLDPTTDRFTFQTFVDAKGGSKKLARILHGTLDELWDELVRLNNAGAGIYVTVNETDFKGRTKKNILRVRALFADLDGVPLDPVLAHAFKPHLIVETSPGKWHVYWLVEGIQRDDFRNLQIMLAERYGSDDKVKDLPRVMRVPGFYHRKGEPVLVRIVDADEALPRYTAEAIVPDHVKDSDAPSGKDFIDESDPLQVAALAKLAAWVPKLFTNANPNTEGVFRVDSETASEMSKERQKYGKLVEDIEFHPIRGIRDYGIADQGDKRKGWRTAVEIVIEYGNKELPDAVAWLRAQLGLEPESGDSTSSLLLDPTDPMRSARTIIATHFTDENQLRKLHRHRSAFWYHESNYYRLTDDETLRARIWQTLEIAYRRDKDGKVVPFKPTRARVSDVLDALGAAAQLDKNIEPPAWLIKDGIVLPATEFVACANGLLHLPSGELYPPTPTYFGLTATEVIYDPNAPEPVQFLAYLDQVLGDTTAIATAQEWSGYVLAPDTSQQKILLGVGPRRSGKGTYARILTKLLGSASVRGPTMSSLGDTFGLESLITASLAIVSDARIGKRTDKSVIVERLLSISGEDQIDVNRKYARVWSGKLLTRIAILTNELPSLTEGSGALVGRFIVLLFPNSFYGKEDIRLTNRLSTELSGILNWAIAGYRRLQERGHFIQPANAAEKIEAMERLGAPVKAFIHDICEVGHPDFIEGVDSLYDTYKAWCRQEGRNDPGTKEWFGRNLHSAVPGLRIARLPEDHGIRARAYAGIRLKPM